MTPLGLAAAAASVRSQAESTAQGYTRGTGALADSLTITGGPLAKVVGSSLREAFFLEFGSPSTGGPRPWLTRPAGVEITKLLEELGQVAGPW